MIFGPRKGAFKPSATDSFNWWTTKWIDHWYSAREINVRIMKFRLRFYCWLIRFDWKRRAWKKRQMGAINYLIAFLYLFKTLRVTSVCNCELMSGKHFCGWKTDYKITFHHLFRHVSKWSLKTEILKLRVKTGASSNFALADPVSKFIRKIC